MSLFAIADTHLSLSTGKKMDVFRGWSDYEYKLKKNWEAVVRPEDTVVIAGDISWAMTMEEGLEDWWATKKKADEFFAKNNLTTLNILHNNTYTEGSLAVCGTRGWFFDAESDADKKVLLREAGRLRASIAAAKQTGLEPVVFLHYPPLNLTQCCDEIYNVLVEENVRRCYYGHLHSFSHLTAFVGEKDSIKFSLIAADFVDFCPVPVWENR